MLMKKFCLCDICKQNCEDISLTFQDNSIKCDSCLQWYHFGCVYISNDSEIPEENEKWYSSGYKKSNQGQWSNWHEISFYEFLYNSITFRFTLQRTVFTYKLPGGSSASHIFNQCSYMEKLAKCLEKHLGKSDILSQCPTPSPSLLHRRFYTYFCYKLNLVELINTLINPVNASVALI